MAEMTLSEFFSWASKQGWAGGTKATDLVNLAGWKVINIQGPDGWSYRDQWTVNPMTNRSFGMTTIFRRSSIMWLMSYGGKYPVKCTPFLKRALLESHSAGNFNGGRGPTTLLDTESDLTYLNNANGNIHQFEGKEEIYERGTLLGFHSYHGMSLLDP